MDTLDFAMNFEDHQQAEADKRLLVVFFKAPVKDEAKTLETGRPIFVEFDMVKIISPGSRDSFIGDATPEYQQRFAAQWERYQRGQEQRQEGTPINQLAWLSVAQVAELQAVGCQTVEALVGMPDVLSQRFMGHHSMKQRAQQYLDAAKGNAPMLQLQNELVKRDEKIAELQASVEALLTKQRADPVQKVPVKM